MRPDEEIQEAIMRWKKPKEIIPRRETESRQYSTGDYGNLKITIPPVTANGSPIYSRGTIIDGNDYLEKSAPPVVVKKAIHKDADAVLDISDLLDYIKSLGIDVRDSVKHLLD